MRNMKNKWVVSIVFFTIGLAFIACDENNNFVLFSIEDDKKLGLQVSQEIAADPTQFPILSRTTNVAAYGYMDDMRNAILNSGEVAYKDEFVWEMHIIDADVLNAFATPGGYIYVYSGLIKYLDTADDLAGVLGHEIAHSDLRHTSRNLQKQQGVAVLLSILLGEDPGQLAQIAGQIAGTISGLSFSRDFEQESDAKSVDYLSNTPYACNGAASFFEKLEAQGQAGGTPEFLSTHPSPDSRVEDINAKATDVGCSTSKLTESSGSLTYAEFQALFK
jgi:predicted Zn-dependent protease